MVARVGNRNRSPRKRSTSCNWLEELDRKVSELPAGSDWLQDSELGLAPQRCRRFIMARFPKLPPRPFPDEVLARELSGGEKQIQDSGHADRILRDLNTGQRRQLGGLLMDVIEALGTHSHHRHSSKTVYELAAGAERRTRMLSRKVSKIRRELEGLRKYAERLHALMGLEYVRAAERCLKALQNLEEDPLAGDFYRSLKSEYPALEDPRQLGMVELYWFFHYECKCSGRESEVRVAMIANEFLACNVAYIPNYTSAESRGCPAVRQAVLRYRPHTTN